MVAEIYLNQYENETGNGDAIIDHLSCVHEELLCNATPHDKHADQVEADEDECEISDLFHIGLIAQVSPKTLTILRSDTICVRRKNSPNQPADSKHGRSKFVSACLDTGEQRSVCGLNEAFGYNSHHPGSFSHMRSKNHFKFGEEIVPTIGIVHIGVAIGNNTHLDLKIDVVELNIPLILGLGVLCGHQIFFYYISNALKCYTHDANLPIKHKHGHVFLEWNQHTVAFT